jgi:hypothetical protein
MMLIDEIAEINHDAPIIGMSISVYRSLRSYREDGTLEERIAAAKRGPVNE